MVYSLNRSDISPNALPQIAGLTIQSSDDAVFLGSLMLLTSQEVERRLDNGNTAYVAWLDGEAAAFGWIARRSARIGELAHEFMLPDATGYLWNFRTLEHFRGKGIYPVLLQHIVQHEVAVNRFLILHAPENKASEAGIKKVGFHLDAKVAVIDEKIHLHPVKEPGHESIAALSLPETDNAPVCCWNCHSPYLTKRKETCCCEPENPCGEHRYLEKPAAATTI